MHYTIAALATLLAFALTPHPANAHGNGLSADVCDTFSVYHGGTRRNDTSKDVYLTLLGENGVVQNCFMPQRTYWVKLSSSYLIKGFMLQAVTGARLPSAGANLPRDVTQGPCPRNTVSHTQKRTERSEELSFPITTKKSTRPLHFRYTVVFSLGSFLENRMLTVPCCEHLLEVVAGEENTTGPRPTAISGSGTVSEPSRVESGSGTTEATSPPFITLPPLGTLASGICGRTVQNIYKSYNKTVDGIRYNCTINRPLKQTICEESCELDSERVQCQVYKHIPRRKGYTCVPYTDCDQVNINVGEHTHFTTYDEIVTTGCQCFTADHSSTSGSAEN